MGSLTSYAKEKLSLNSSRRSPSLRTISPSWITPGRGEIHLPLQELCDYAFTMFHYIVSISQDTVSIHHVCQYTVRILSVYLSLYCCYIASISQPILLLYCQHISAYTVAILSVYLSLYCCYIVSISQPILLLYCQDIVSISQPILLVYYKILSVYLILLIYCQELLLV